MPNLARRPFFTCQHCGQLIPNRGIAAHLRNCSAAALARKAAGTTPTPHSVNGGTRLSEAYKRGLDGLPFAAHMGTKTSAAYAAWKRGCTDRALHGDKQ